MITAVDSSVLLDVVTDSPEHADASEEALRSARREGGLIINECVLAEIRPAFKTGEFDEFLADWQLKFVPSSKESAMLAGKLFGRYLARGGRAQRVLPDFLIGAHALLHADRLLARDRGYLRDYFAKLRLWQPGS
ncbi:MAG: type II toxin-antitoxin system VapC family toxin [Gammaproteobacteria bacterium]